MSGSCISRRSICTLQFAKSEQGSVYRSESLTSLPELYTSLNFSGMHRVSLRSASGLNGPLHLICSLYQVKNSRPDRNTSTSNNNLEITSSTWENQPGSSTVRHT